MAASSMYYYDCSRDVAVECSLDYHVPEVPDQPVKTEVIYRGPASATAPLNCLAGAFYWEASAVFSVEPSTSHGNSYKIYLEMSVHISDFQSSACNCDT